MSNNAKGKPLKSQLISADETDIPAGWPRPHYYDDNDKKTGAIKYATWSTASAASQINHCHTDRLYRAACSHLCSSCGDQMVKGLVFHFPDFNSVSAEFGDGSAWREYMNQIIPVDDRYLFPQKMDSNDSSYGSPICFRCFVFASRHCPWIKGIYDLIGTGFVMRETTDPGQYKEVDETGAISLLNPDSHPKWTLEEVRNEVQNGRLHLTGMTAEDFEWIVRPRCYDEERGFKDSVLHNNPFEGSSVAPYGPQPA